jgi:RNA polymerase sigma-70 factor, ECF subfamily
LQSEVDILKACLKSDKNAQKALYERYIGKMNAVCRRYIASEEERKDVVQDGFVKVFQNIQHYRSDGPLEAWIRRVVVNTALSHLRKQRRGLDSDTIPLDEYDEQSAEAYVNQEETIAQADFSKEVLMEAIDALPEKYKVVFNLYCIDNYAHKTIAEMLSITEEGSRTRLKRAKEMLQLYLTRLHKIEINNSNTVG